MRTKLSLIADEASGSVRGDPLAVIAITATPGQQAFNRAMPAAADQLIDVGALFETCHDRVFRYVLTIVKDPAEAEDLTQETFLRAHNHAGALRDPNAVRGWLYRIATHVCLDRLRQYKPVCSLDDDGGDHSRLNPVSDNPSPLEISERRETSICVQRCLDFLPDPYRAVILLHKAHSLTAREIADLLGITVATAKIRLHRARRMLKDVMERGCALSTDKHGTPVCEPKG